MRPRPTLAAAVVIILPALAQPRGLLPDARGAVRAPTRVPVTATGDGREAGWWIVQSFRETAPARYLLAAPATDARITFDGSAIATELADGDAARGLIEAAVRGSGQPALLAGWSRPVVVSTEPVTGGVV